MTHHTKTYTQITPRPLNALEAQEVERWLVYNAQRIAQLDTHIAACSKQGGSTILEVARKHYER